MRFSLSLIVFVLVLVAIAGIFEVVTILHLRAKRRQIRALLKPTSDLSELKIPMPADSTDTAKSSRIRLLGGFPDLTGLETLLLSANVSLLPEHFLILTVAAGLTGFFATLALSRNSTLSVLVMGSMFALPLLHLLHRRHLRDSSLVQQLPDALDMIIRALRVGQTVDNSLKEVGRICPSPLGVEIQTIYEEIALGIPFTAALHNFEVRFARLADVKLMTTAFIIQHETGGNLTRVLTNLSDLIRERDRLKHQVRAITAETRSSALILGVLPLAVAGFFWIIRPVYIQMLFSHPVGRKMVLIAALLEITGFLSMRLITRIEP